ncbi:TadE/TadG family type IV pilus assembly protein [Paenibacillus abyssi]|uniref:Putative Flp pilus-assembly TadG-like N-terminal domain-containing protein n=1 Tax=Paenibacillus abyssi TaxID=1340531 RepID=A0A917CWC6_9BACL|nr:Tad domain-containing protein [Paenibacillus abyssi]GGG00551.1 hypothetical protein GCM10010916_17150 [Paenibacillus abyssi]
MKQTYRLLSQQRGSALVLAAFVMLGLLVVAALILDGGAVYVSKIRLQIAANAAVLSGAQELTNQPTAVYAVVQKVVKDHDGTASLKDTTVIMEHRVSVHLKKQVPLTFSRLLGIQAAPVDVTAAAEIQTDRAGDKPIIVAIRLVEREHS